MNPCSIALDNYSIKQIGYTAGWWLIVILTARQVSHWLLQFFAHILSMVLISRSHSASIHPLKRPGHNEQAMQIHMDFNNVINNITSYDMIYSTNRKSCYASLVLHWGQFSSYHWCSQNPSHSRHQSVHVTQLNSRRVQNSVIQSFDSQRLLPTNWERLQLIHCDFNWLEGN